MGTLHDRAAPVATAPSHDAAWRVPTKPTNRHPMKSSLETFDGRDNRRDIMTMLFQLGGDKDRARFLKSLIPLSLKGFASAPMKVTGNCDPVAAYFMLVGICNELGVDINDAARKLEQRVKRL